MTATINSSLEKTENQQKTPENSHLEPRENTQETTISTANAC